MPSTIAAKLRRIRSGRPPRLLDLFSGCGGISLGFHSVGFAVCGAIESDSHAARSHALNFFGADDREFERHAVARDITELEPHEVVAELPFSGRSETAIDFIVGGPPCQAYARVGRAKLREVDAHPEAFLHDPRGNLYLRYLHYVRALQPLGLLLENVPDVMNVGGHNVAHEVCEALSDLGYECGYTLLNAAYYGVPQMRERMYLLAYRKELGSCLKFPRPTHWVDLPAGYRGSRRVALQSVERYGAEQRELFEGDDWSGCFYQEPPSPGDHLPPAVTTREALADLPPITAHLRGSLLRGARRFDELMPYGTGTPCSGYARLMRTWPGFEGGDGVYDHVIRSLPRDYPIFEAMEPGDQYPEAKAIAEKRLLPKAIARERKRLNRALSAAEMEAITKKVVPPYDAGKFPNKWRKLDPDSPSRTLMAHLGKDSYSHIHFDDDQARTISVREAARLQSFPDGFAFCGTMNPAFRQIGNAVPPLMSRAIAVEVMAAITGNRRLSMRRFCRGVS